jgi:hypothetical protein
MPPRFRIAIAVGGPGLRVVTSERTFQVGAQLFDLLPEMLACGQPDGIIAAEAPRMPDIAVTDEPVVMRVATVFLGRRRVLRQAAASDVRIVGKDSGIRWRNQLRSVNFFSDSAEKTENQNGLAQDDGEKDRLSRDIETCRAGLIRKIISIPASEFLIIMSNCQGSHVDQSMMNVNHIIVFQMSDTVLALDRGMFTAFPSCSVLAWR